MNKWLIFVILFLVVQPMQSMRSIHDFNARILLHNNYIIIKITGQGKKKINGMNYYVDAYPLPDIIVINGEKQKSNSNYSYNLNKTENVIKLEWSNKIDNCNYMFYECFEITEIDLTNFDSSNVTQTKMMFYKCESLTSLNLINFNTSKVKLMDNMFSDCKSLSSLNLSNFDTSQVTSMHSMFNDCFSLNLSDLSNFNTSKVESMGEMFSNCRSLTFLNLSNFDTSSVTLMNNMFDNCNSLVSLDLSNFKTSKVTSMNNMFSNCHSLTSLDLSNFETQNLENTDYMFYNCSKLEYLNIKAFIFGNITTYNEIFYLTPKNMVICTQDNIIKQEIIDMKESKNISCPINWEQKNETNENDNSYELNSTFIGDIEENTETYLKEINNIITSEISTNYLTTYIQNYFNHNETNNVIKNNKCNLSYDIDSYEEINLNILLEYLNYNNKFNEIIEYGCEIKPNEKRAKFTLSKLEFDYSLVECQKDFDKYYNDLYHNKTLFLLNITIEKDSNGNIQNLYEMYYPSEKNGSFIKLNLNNFVTNCSLKTWLSKCASYSIESLINKKCLSCENKFGYYPMYNNINNTFIECFNSLDGYFLDEENMVFKECYQTCEKCNKGGNIERHNCLKCKGGYNFENISNSYLGNCYEFKNNSSNISITNCNIAKMKHINMNLTILVMKNVQLIQLCQRKKNFIAK